MLTLVEAQAILAAVGSDNPPAAEQLAAARDAFVKFANDAKNLGDKVLLATLLANLQAAKLALTEAEAREAEAAAEIEALVADIPELAGEPAAAADEPAAAAVEEAPAMLSAAEVIARLGLTPQAAAPVIEVIEPAQTLTINGDEHSGATLADLAEAFAKNTKSSMREGRNTIAAFRTEYAVNLTSKADQNVRILDQLARQAADSAVIAAGGCCSLAEPLRDQPMLASLSRPIADRLPTVGATHGAVTMFPPVCLPAGGVGLWTCAQDADVDPEDPDTWKVCDEVECADPMTVTVDAIYRCLTIGNFQQRFSPERWEAILHATLAQQARLAERALFTQIATSTLTTQHTVVDTGSIYATFLDVVIRAAATIRQNQRYEGVRIEVIAPSWLLDAIDADRIARAVQRGRTIEGSGIDALLAEKNIDVIWSPDISPIEPNGQVTGPLSLYPATADIVVFADGGVFRLDGGELNLGTEIRDHNLNRQNALAAFGESFEKALVRSCDSKKITLPVTVCGSAPCTAPAGPGSSEENPLFMQTVEP